MSDFLDAYNAGQENSSPMTITAPNGAVFAIYSKSHTVQELPSNVPLRLIHEELVADWPSFVGYFTRYANKCSMVRVHSQLKDYGGGFTGIIDNHEYDGTARWQKHQVKCFPALSIPFQRWLKADRKEMTQEEFAAHVEDCSADFREPSAAAMLELATQFNATEQSIFKRGIRLQSGTVQLQYAQQIDESGGLQGQVNVPRVFRLGMQIYRDGPAYAIEARFKYRIREGGKLLMAYELLRLQETAMLAFADIEKQVRAALGEVFIVNV